MAERMPRWPFRWYGVRRDNDGEDNVFVENDSNDFFSAISQSLDRTGSREGNAETNLASIAADQVEMARSMKTYVCYKLDSLSSALSLCTNLVSIRVGYGQIESISNIENLCNLRILALPNNRIHRVDGLQSNTALETLILDHNPIRELPPDCFAHQQRLKKLSLCGSLLFCMDNILETISHLDHLEELRFQTRSAFGPNDIIARSKYRVIMSTTTAKNLPTKETEIEKDESDFEEAEPSNQVPTNVASLRLAQLLLCSPIGEDGASHSISMNTVLQNLMDGIVGGSNDIHTEEIESKIAQLKISNKHVMKDHVELVANVLKHLKQRDHESHIDWTDVFNTLVGNEFNLTNTMGVEQDRKSTRSLNVGHAGLSELAVNESLMGSEGSILHTPADLSHLLVTGRRLHAVEDEGLHTTDIPSNIQRVLDEPSVECMDNGTSDYLLDECVQILDDRIQGDSVTRNTAGISELLTQRSSAGHNPFEAAQTSKLVYNVDFSKPEFDLDIPQEFRYTVNQADRETNAILEDLLLLVLEGEGDESPCLSLGERILRDRDSDAESAASDEEYFEQRSLLRTSAVCFEKYYRARIIEGLPRLKVLDSVPVTPLQRLSSNGLPYGLTRPYCSVHLIADREIGNKHPWQSFSSSLATGISPSIKKENRALPQMRECAALPPTPTRKSRSGMRRGERAESVTSVSEPFEVLESWSAATPPTYESQTRFRRLLSSTARDGSESDSDGDLSDSDLGQDGLEVIYPDAPEHTSGGKTKLVLKRKNPNNLFARSQESNASGLLRDLPAVLFEQQFKKGNEGLLDSKGEECKEEKVSYTKTKDATPYFSNASSYQRAISASRQAQYGPTRLLNSTAPILPLKFSSTGARPVITTVKPDSDWLPRQFEYHPTIPDRAIVGTMHNKLHFIDMDKGTSIGCADAGFPEGSGQDGEEVQSSVLGLCWLHKSPEKCIFGTDLGCIRMLDIDRVMEGRVHSSIVYEYTIFPKLTSLHVSCTDDLLLSSGNRYDVHLYDTRTGQLLKNMKQLHTGNINVLKWANHSPHMFATSSFDKSIKVWDLRQSIVTDTMRPCFVCKILTLARQKVTWSPDDRFLLSSAVDNEVHQWHSDGRHFMKMDIMQKNSDTNYTRAYYTTNGEHVVSGSCGEKIVRLLNARTGRLLRTIDISQHYNDSSLYVQSLRGDPMKPFTIAVLISFLYSRPSHLITVDLLRRDVVQRY